MSFQQTLKFTKTGNPRIYDYVFHLACHFIYTALESAEKTEINTSYILFLMVVFRHVILSIVF